MLWKEQCAHMGTTHLCTFLPAMPPLNSRLQHWHVMLITSLFKRVSIKRIKTSSSQSSQYFLSFWTSVSFITFIRTSKQINLDHSDPKSDWSRIHIDGKALLYHESNVIIKHILVLLSVWLCFINKPGAWKLHPDFALFMKGVRLAVYVLGYTLGGQYTRQKQILIRCFG